MSRVGFILIAVGLLLVLGAALAWWIYAALQYLRTRKEVASNLAGLRALAIPYRAYVVGRLDVSLDPPRVVYVGIFSSPAGQVTGMRGYFDFDISHIEGVDFHEAHERAEAALREGIPGVEWATEIYLHPWRKETVA